MAGTSASDPLHDEVLPPLSQLAAPPAWARPELQSPARGPLFGRNGAVASAQPLASLTGRDVLSAGGNAMDAALAMSAVMIVVQPFSSHLGGDAFALIQTADGETSALNAGGRAPMAATVDAFPNEIPRRGPMAITVPGLVDAWCATHSRFATKPLRELLAPAIELAREGFTVSDRFARILTSMRDLLTADPGWAEVFQEEGHAKAGAVLRQPDLASTLEAIGGGGREAFYEGTTGLRIAEYVQQRGGLLSKEDLESDQAVWGEPISTTYRGWTVFQQPLPSQGFVTLEALNILESLDIKSHDLVSAEAVHPAVEAMRLAFIDRFAQAGDPDVVDVPLESLLSKEHASNLAGRIGSKAATKSPSTSGGDTTSFAVADASGNLVSFIQSLFHPWGAALLVPGTGVLLNDRMCGFSLDPASPNALRPGKRTMHTLNAWLLEEQGGRVYAGGTPGGDFQVQTNLQLITAMVDWGLDAQGAVNAPKWALTGPGTLAIEGRFPPATVAELERRGHEVKPTLPWATGLCLSQIVGYDRSAGALLAASDMRGDGSALAW